MARLILFSLNCLSSLSLRQLQRLGAIFGWVAYYLSPKFANRIRTNLVLCKVQAKYQLLDQMVKRSAQEICKGALEMSICWTRSPEYIASLVTDCHGWEHVEAAIAAHKAVVFITPHLGNFELAGRYLSQRFPGELTAMYRPSKLKWLEPILSQGRIRGKGHSAPATVDGVRIILKALKRKEAIIVLPDQVPVSDGVWMSFFGVPAYSMTLAARLANISNVQVLYFVGERLENGKGFVVHIEAPNEKFSGDKNLDTLKINQVIERIILRFPEQYLWSYNRFKCPSGVSKPQTESGHK